MQTLPQAGAAPLTIPGTMMDIPLSITSILEHAARGHAGREIVSRDDDGSVHRYTYADFARRVAQLAHALIALGVRPGDRVASFAWNTHRHLELYYAVPCIGAVLHTANIRLFPEQVAFVFDHAEDRVVFVDAALVSVVERAIAVGGPSATARAYVVMGAAPLPAALPNALDYEELLAGGSTTFAWPTFDERSAAIMCYTSATTGDPKAVLFSHRSTVLHAYCAALPDHFGLHERDVVLPVVPMFHVNAWGLPFMAPLVGAKLVLPGAKLDAASLIELIERERVTCAAGVPTVWLAVRDELLRRDLRLPALERIVSGGSAVPPGLLDDLDARGIRIIHAWGMTEMSPIGSMAYVQSALADAPPERIRQARLSQGPIVPNVQWEILDDDGRAVPADGVARGELWVRGPCVASEYFRNPAASAAAFAEGWFRTGDICTVDEYGYLRIVDRTKDLIKSGGEWISSVELENLLMSHPAVKEAAVVGVPHPRWIERPIAVVVPRNEMALDGETLRAWLAKRVAKWMVPDRIVFVDAIPRTGVGKFLKRELRERYRDLFT